MKIYLIRHGQTDRNKQKRLQGRNGLPLNQEGVSQAKLLSQKLKDVKFDFVYSSPQQRAVDTATIVTNKQPIIDNRIDVFDLGSADGLLVEEAIAFFKVIPDPTVYEGVEIIDDFIKRVYAFMDELVTKYKDQNVTIAICGHKCTTGCMSAYFEGIPKDKNFLNLSVKNGDCKIYEYPFGN